MVIQIFEPWTKNNIPATGHVWKRSVGYYPWTKTDLPATAWSLTQCRPNPSSRKYRNNSKNALIRRVSALVYEVQVIPSFSSSCLHDRSNRKSHRSCWAGGLNFSTAVNCTVSSSLLQEHSYRNTRWLGKLEGAELRMLL